MLRATPEPWQPEDSILTVLAMFNTLQGRQALFEQTHGALRDTLPEPMFRFLSAAGSEWETPVMGDARASARRFRDRTCVDLRHVGALRDTTLGSLSDDGRACLRGLD